MSFLYTNKLVKWCITMRIIKKMWIFVDVLLMDGKRELFQSMVIKNVKCLRSPVFYRYLSLLCGSCCCSTSSSAANSSGSTSSTTVFISLNSVTVTTKTYSLLDVVVSCKFPHGTWDSRGLHRMTLRPCRFYKTFKIAAAVCTTNILIL